MSNKIKNTAKLLAIGTVSFLAINALKTIKTKAEKHNDHIDLSEQEKKAWDDVRRNAGFID
jgi:hypothetical protein